MKKVFIRMFYSAAALSAVVVIVDVSGHVKPPPSAPPKNTEYSPQTRARALCMAMQSSPEYRVSSAGGSYRRNTDELCDELLREAVRR
jgi:hypothetical protein